MEDSERIGDDHRELWKRVDVRDVPPRSGEKKELDFGEA
jgi:hypothetical protein